MSHYLLEKSVTGKPSPFTTFYYPSKMFSDAQTTLNVLVTLEDGFIAALPERACRLGLAVSHAMRPVSAHSARMPPRIRG